MNDHGQKGVLFFGVFVLVVLGLLIGAYFWYVDKEQERPMAELTNALLMTFPGSEMRLYSDLFALQDDARLDHFEAVLGYAKRGGVEVALVKEDINAVGTDIVFSRQGGAFDPLYVADAREKRSVALSPSGAFIAYSYFSQGLGEGQNYADVNLWRTVIVKVADESIVRELPGYGLQFISDEVALIGGGDGILSLDIETGALAPVGVSFPTLVGIPSFAVSENSTQLIVSDRRGNRYHLLSIQGMSPLRLGYSTALSMDVAGTLVGVVGDTLVFGKSEGPETPISITERMFGGIDTSTELFTTNRL